MDGENEVPGRRSSLRMFRFDRRGNLHPGVRIPLPGARMGYRIPDYEVTNALMDEAALATRPELRARLLPVLARIC